MQGLRDYADDKDFQKKWQHVKGLAKEKAVAKIKSLTGVEVRPDAIMDVQVSSCLPLRSCLSLLARLYSPSCNTKFSTEQHTTISCYEKTMKMAISIACPDFAPAGQRQGVNETYNQIARFYTAMILPELL